MWYSTSNYTLMTSKRHLKRLLLQYLWDTCWMNEVARSSQSFIFCPQLEQRSSLGRVAVSSPTTGRLTSVRARVWTVWRWASAPHWRMESWCASTALRGWETTSCSTLWVLFPRVFKLQIRSRVYVEFYTVVFSHSHARGRISDPKSSATCERVCPWCPVVDWSSFF